MNISRTSLRASGALISALLAVTVASVQATPVSATTPIVNSGDIVTVTFGGLFDGGSGIDKIDPVTHVRSRVVSFGIAKGFDQVVALPSTDLLSANQDGEVWRVDHLTGVKTQVRSGTQQHTVAYGDLVAETNTSALAIIREDTGNRIVRMSTTCCVGLQLISQDPLVTVTADELAIDYDGSVLVAESGDKRLVRVNLSTGAASVMATFPGRADSVVVAKDGQIYVRVTPDTGLPQLRTVSRVDGSSKVVSTGGYLSDSDGLAVEADGSIVSTETGTFDNQTAAIVRINPFTGNQTRLFEMSPDGTENQEVTVVGVSQTGGIPRPVAVADTRTMDGGSGQLELAAPGVLGNDTDPLGRKLGYEQVTNPTHGFTSAFPDGHLFYFPNTNYVGTDSWTYRAVSSDGRRSTATTVTITVTASQTPTAHPDTYTMAQGAILQVPAPGVLANDTDPQGDPLIAKMITAPLHGLATINSDGALFYQPAQSFSGQDTLTYTARDTALHVSAAVTVTLNVGANTAPSVAVSNVSAAISAGIDGRSGTFPLSVSDTETPAGQLTLSASSSNTTVVPNGSIVFGTGADGRPSITITAASGTTGVATVTVTVSDGKAASTTRVTVMAGTSANDTLTGTSGADLLLGKGSGDILNGAGGRDIVSGGDGADTLTGGTGPDHFQGGAGADTVTDLTALDGDTGSA
jgi:hypothetical protein